MILPSRHGKSIIFSQKRRQQKKLSLWPNLTIDLLLTLFQTHKNKRNNFFAESAYLVRLSFEIFEPELHVDPIFPPALRLRLHQPMSDGTRVAASTVASCWNEGHNGTWVMHFSAVCLVYFIGELSDRTYRLGSVTIKTKCVKLNY